MELLFIVILENFVQYIVYDYGFDLNFEKVSCLIDLQIDGGHQGFISGPYR